MGVSKRRALSYLASSDVVVYGLGFLYGIAAARILGPADFGILLIVISAVKLLACPFNLSLGSPLKRLLPRADRSRERQRIFWGATTLQATAMVPFLVVVGAGLYLMPVSESVRWAVELFAISEASFQTRYIGSGLVALERYGQKSTWGVLESIGRNLVPLPFLMWGVTAACLGYVVAEALIVASAFVWFRQLPDTLDFPWSRIWREARSNYGAGILNTAWNRSLPLMIGAFAGSAGTAFFNVGRKFKHVLRLMVHPVREYLFPRLVDDWKSDRDVFRHKLGRYFKWMVPIIAAACFGLMLGAPIYIPMIYGSEYAASVWVLWIILPFAAGKMVLSIYRPVVFAAGRPRLLLGLNVIRAALGIPLVMLATWYGGYIGAALGVSAVAVVLIYYQVSSIRSLLGMGREKTCPACHEPMEVTTTGIVPEGHKTTGDTILWWHCTGCPNVIGETVS